MRPRTLLLTIVLMLGWAGSAYATQGTDSINAVLDDESWHGLAPSMCKGGPKKGPDQQERDEVVAAYDVG